MNNLKISTKLRDDERFYIQQLIASQKAFPAKTVKEVPEGYTHRLIVKFGSIVGYERVRYNENDVL